MARGAFDASEKEWDLTVIDEAHGFTIAVDAKGCINKKSECERLHSQLGNVTPEEYEQAYYTLPTGSPSGDAANKKTA